MKYMKYHVLIEMHEVLDVKVLVPSQKPSKYGLWKGGLRRKNTIS